MSKIKKNEMERLYNYFKKINNLSPFPIIDTEIIDIIKNKIDDDTDYDSEPVISCIHCQNLALVIDEEGNDICPLCKNSINEVEVHKTIFHYLNKYPNRWL